MACGYQENGLDAYPVGTHRQKEVPVLLICTHEEALAPQPVPQMAAVGISGKGGSEQPLKKLPILLLHPCLPAAFLPTVTLFAVTCTTELLFQCQSSRWSQLETRSLQVPS